MEEKYSFCAQTGTPGEGWRWAGLHVFTTHHTLATTFSVHPGGRIHLLEDEGGGPCPGGRAEGFMVALVGA